MTVSSNQKRRHISARHCKRIECLRTTVEAYDLPSSHLGKPDVVRFIHGDACGEGVSLFQREFMYRQIVRVNFSELITAKLCYPKKSIGCSCDSDWHAYRCG